MEQSSYIAVRIGASLLSALALAGCASAPASVTESQPWIEVRSEHFTVDTDLDSAQAVQATLQLERMRLALLGVLASGADVPVGIHAVVFARPRDLAGFGELVRSGFWDGDDRLLVVMNAGPAAQSWLKMTPEENQAHELAHAISAYFVPHQPRWIAAGIASWLETVVIEPDGQTATFGRPFPPYVWFIQNYGAARLSDMQAWRIPKELAGAFHVDTVLYASAWAWVNWMITREPQRFAEFERRDAAGEDPPRAFAEAFPAEVLRNSRYVVTEAAVQPVPPWTVALAPISGSVSARPLSLSDVEALMARLWAVGPWLVSDRDRARAVAVEVHRALQADPMNLAARWMQLEISRPELQLELARALTRDHPESAEAWVALMDTLCGEHPDDPEVGVAMEHATALGPEDAWAMKRLARELLQHHDDQDALALAQRMVTEVPWSAPALDTYAAILMRLGRCGEAAAAEQRALGDRDGNWQRAQGTYAARLEAIRTSCSEGEPIPAAVEERLEMQPPSTAR